MKTEVSSMVKFRRTMVFLLLFCLVSSSFVSLFVFHGIVSAETASSMPPMKGMTVNAWSADAYNSSDFDQSITNLANTGANWVMLTVFWFMNTSTDTEMQPRPDLYTASDSSLIHAIQEAQQLGLKVALKPMVDVLDGTWRGQIAPTNWTLWFQNYGNFIDYYAAMAQTYNVALFTVGTELRSSQQYTSEWEQVISQARTHFFGNMTYAANWDTWVPGAGYNVGFWADLDYVGVDAYFPLTNSYDPTLSQLISAWSNCTASGWWGTNCNWTNELYSTYVQTGKPIVFTEIGYTSQNGTNTEPWTNVSQTVDLQEQADCYQAALEVFKDKSWFNGWFWWDWETNPNAGGLADTNYTPQNKPCQNILYQYYSSITVTFQAAAASVPVTVSYSRVTGNYTGEGSLAIPWGASNFTTIPYGSTVTFSYESPVGGGSGIQYVLVSTAPGSPLTNVVNDTTVTGNYETQYYLIVKTDPLGIVTIPGEDWYDAASYVTLTAPAVQNYTFSYWDIDGTSQGNGTNPVIASMNKSHAATAHYEATPQIYHDVAIINVTALKNVVGQGYCLYTSVTVANQGDYSEAFNITVYANQTNIATLENVTLTSGNSTSVISLWNTTEFACGNYTLSAYVSLVPGETNNADNNLTGGTVYVGIPGDLNADGKVNILDAILLSNAFGASPGSSNWNANADINGDGVVNILDAIILANNFL